MPTCTHYGHIYGLYEPYKGILGLQWCTLPSYARISRHKASAQMHPEGHPMYPVLLNTPVNSPYIRHIRVYCAPSTPCRCMCVHTVSTVYYSVQWPPLCTVVVNTPTYSPYEGHIGVQWAPIVPLWGDIGWLLGYPRYSHYRHTLYPVGAVCAHIRGV